MTIKSTQQHTLVASIALTAALSAAALAQSPPPAAKAGAAASSSAAPTGNAAAVAAPPAAPVISAEQASYDFGVTFGSQLKSAGLSQDVSADALLRGLKDALGGKTLTAAESQQVGQYVRAVREAAGMRNATAAKEFLERNKQQSGIKSTASGLQYKVVAAGDTKAASPQPEDQVTVQYRGKLIDGTEFDSSYSRGQPATFPANRVIKGWQEALLLMKPGSQYQLFVPPDLAYGQEGRPNIPPGSLLIFDVELVSVQAASAPAAAPKTKADGSQPR
jgi:FKBP-type peptidyl-prolyl cis-trans isomerase FklB